MYKKFLGLLFFVLFFAAHFAFALPEINTGLMDAEYARDAAQFSAPHSYPYSFQAQDDDARNYNVLSYDLKASFDWPSNKLSAVLNIAMELPARMNSIVLDSNVTQVKKVEFNKTTALPFTIDRSNGLLKIDISSISQDLASRELDLTITYETEANYIYRGIYISALRAVPPRKGDPNKTRVLSTFSEPLGASYWMPSNNRPDDRAKFSVEFSMPANERLISNGDLILDQVDENQIHHMKYSTRYTLPTYLMAFAVGDFVTATHYHGQLPVSIWARRGTNMDFESMLETLTQQIQNYEKLLGPYPFEKYAIVLLPEHHGGIEHAGITFQGEGTSTDPQSSGTLALMAHELGHQWFGDFVTIQAWDDLWIKEGMATLLAAESMRPWEDENNSGRLFGSSFWAKNGEAIYAPDIAPEAKYNSGPYGRAAWLLTQIRSLVGEKTFWEDLRAVLKDHAFGNISTADFLEYFHDSLGEALFQKAKKAVIAKKLPILTASATETNKILFNLTDEDNFLLQPLKFASVHADGSSSNLLLENNGSITIEKTSDSFWIIDPQDYHADIAFWTDKTEQNIYSTIATILAPGTAELKKQFLLLNGAHQQRALSQTNIWNLTSDEFSDFYSALATENGRFYSLRVACDLLNKKGMPEAEVAAWKNILWKKFNNPPYLGIPSYSGNLYNCGIELPKEVFSLLWYRIKNNPTTAIYNDAELHFLAKFALPNADALELWGNLVNNANFINYRQDALSYLASVFQNNWKQMTSAELVQWQKFFDNILTTTEVSNLLYTALGTAQISKDTAALEPIKKLIFADYPKSTQGGAFCAANAILQGQDKNWQDFITSLGDPQKLPVTVQRLLKDPTLCQLGY